MERLPPFRHGHRHVVVAEPLEDGHDRVGPRRGHVAGQHDHDIVAGRGQRREQASERALAGVAVGDGPVEAE